MMTYPTILFVVMVLMITALPTTLSLTASEPRYGNKSFMHKAITQAFTEYGVTKKDVSDEDDLLYFFTVHDYDQDGLLDGHELRVAFGDHNDERRMSLDEVERVIDGTLSEDDVDNDGKISWEEYLASIKYRESI